MRFCKKKRINNYKFLKIYNHEKEPKAYYNNPIKNNQYNNSKYQNLHIKLMTISYKILYRKL